MLDAVVAPAGLIDGLTHLWNFENNLDDVVGGLNGTAIAGTGFGVGKVGGNSVDLTTGYIDITSEVITDQQNNYTWSAWFKNSGTFGYILESSPDTVFAMSAVAGYPSAASVRTHIQGLGGGWRQRDDTLSSPSDWNLIVVTYDGSLPDSSAGTVYLNGTLAGNVSTVGIGGDITPLASTSGLHIGADRAGTGRFEGQLDEVAVWDRTISGAEAAQLYNSGNGFDLSAVPEPSTFAIFAIGGCIVGLGYRRRKRSVA